MGRQGRVKDPDNLRIIDAPVMPDYIRACTGCATIMIAQRTPDIL